MIGKIGIIFIVALIKVTNGQFPILPDGFQIVIKINLAEILQAVLQSNVTDNACFESLKSYWLGIVSGELWAIQMLDSSAKVPEGLFKGHLHHLGNFDECLEAKNKDFMGKYCLADYTIDFSPSTEDGSETALKFSEDDYVRLSEKKTDKLAFTLHAALCIPSTCPAPELKILIGKVLDYVPFIQDFDVKEEACSTAEPKPYSIGFWITTTFFVIMVIIVLSSTYFEFRELQKGNKRPHPLYTSFSLWSNGRFLFDTTVSPGHMTALHGMRAITILWVVLGHAYFHLLFAPIINMADRKSFVQDVHHVLLINAVVSIDTFFFLSGLLVCVVFYREIEKKGGYDVILGYIHRYIRITVAMAVVILFIVSMYRYLSNGPLWHDIILNQSVDKCEKNWYYAVLYVQNLAGPPLYILMCLGQTWYVSIDMQLYWIAPIFLYAMLLLPERFGVGFMYVTITAWVVWTFALDYVNMDSPNLYLANYLPDKDPDQFKNEYANTWIRAGPWLIGLTFGYYLMKIRREKIKIELSKTMVAVGWFFSTGVCLGVLYGIIPFLDVPPSRTQWENAIYFPLYRVGWSLGLIWIIFACTYGYGGPVNNFLSLGVFVPFSKLSFCVYLVHTLVQKFRIGRSRTNMYVGDPETVWDALGDWVLSNLLAIPLTLIFEMPFLNLERYLLANAEIFRYPKKKKDLQVEERGENVQQDNTQPREGTRADKTAAVVDIEPEQNPQKAEQKI